MGAPPLNEFRRIWPKAVAEDQRRLVSAWELLSSDERTAAIAGVAPYLTALREAGRSTGPTGAVYLGSKLWRFLNPEASS